jgi:two-component system cell cycle sensor histidine kinase/response regulator CckA
VSDRGNGDLAASAPAREGWYRDIFESALLGIYASRVDGTLKWCNATFARLLGFESVQQVLAPNQAPLHIPPDQRGAWLDEMRNRGGRLERARLQFRRRDGEILHVIATIVGAFDSAGQLAELRGFIIDVPESPEAADTLKERERQFHSVFLDAADAMLILDDGRRIVDANRAAATLFEVSRETLIGRLLDDLVMNEANQLSGAWRELETLGEAKSAHRVLSGSRGLRLVDCSYRAAVHPGHHLCIARDITERRLLEERLVQSEKVESVGRLAGGIAHDFNNLLTAILGYTELLLSKHEANDRDRQDLEEIQRAGQRAAALTQQLLAYSRKQVLVPREVDLNETVLNLQSMLTRLIREDISLTYELAPIPALVKIDPTQVEQVILNLVINSRDAMPAGGSIRLEVARVLLAEVEVPSDHATHAREFVRLRVIDDGVGISPEVRAHLFEPFFTTKEVGKGTGLGLASVYGIVRQSNGFIGVESEPGLGATFTMHFPAVATTEPIDGPTVVSSAPTGGCETILLVEDEDAVRAIVSAGLRRQGYHVLETASPRRAIEMFEKDRTEIDLLLTDVVMPEMNGPSLAQRLVAIRPALRILFMSGYADVAFDAGGQNVGFLSKPFPATTLAAKVRELLSR